MYKLSKRSLSKLKGVHPDLVRVVKRAIEITDVDFSVTLAPSFSKHRSVEVVVHVRVVVKLRAAEKYDSTPVAGPRIRSGRRSDREAQSQGG